MADFNWDKNRNTGFTNIMNNFVKKLELHDVWDTFPVDYTHIHTDLKSVSTIERILVNKGLTGCLVDAGALHLGDNLSRHSPIMVKLDVGSIPKNIQSNNRTIRRPAWDKADAENIDTYTSELDSKLRSLAIPDSLFCSDPHCKNMKHISERDSYIMDILSEIIETSYATVPLSGRGGSKWNPEKNCRMGKVVPRWKEEVEPFRQDAMFWHSVWISADKPKTGELHSLMCRTRNRYHYAIRRVKKKADSINAEQLLLAAEKGDAHLLKEMKNINCKKASSTLPECVEDADNPAEIVERFRAVYSALYNSAPSNIQELSDKIIIDNTAANEIGKITGKVVKDAACRMKPGKNDVSGGYSSDAILNGPDSLFDALAAAMRSFLTHGTVT